MGVRLGWVCFGAAPGCRLLARPALPLGLGVRGGACRHIQHQHTPQGTLPHAGGSRAQSKGKALTWSRGTTTTAHTTTRPLTKHTPKPIPGSPLASRSEQGWSKRGIFLDYDEAIDAFDDMLVQSGRATRAGPVGSNALSSDFANVPARPAQSKSNVILVPSAHLMATDTRSETSRDVPLNAIFLLPFLRWPPCRKDKVIC